MAYYRQIYTTFWTDSKVADDFTPEDKYFYLYLLTNAHTNLCGCYEISKKQISNDTGYTIDVVTRLLARLEQVHGIIRYSEETKEVYLVNWHKYNWSKSEKVLKGVATEIEHIKSDIFKALLLNLLESYGYPIDTVCIGYTYPMDTSVSVTVTDTVSNTVKDISYDKSNNKSNNNNYINNNINNSTTEIDPEILTDFDNFWEVYPKKVGKKDAKRAFVRAKKSVDADTMIRAVIAQKKSLQWTRDNGRYIPNPATWLNQGRWDDEIQTKGNTSFGIDWDNV